MIDWATLAHPKVCPTGPKHPERLSEDAFRKEVWRRHKERSRFSDMPLVRGAADLRIRGEVCHLRCRRVRPDWLTDPDHAILLSAYEHWLSDARGNCRLRLLEPDSNTRATSSITPIRFVLTDHSGRVLQTVVR